MKRLVLVLRDFCCALTDPSNGGYTSRKRQWIVTRVHCVVISLPRLLYVSPKADFQQLSLLEHNVWTGSWSLVVTLLIHGQQGLVFLGEGHHVEAAFHTAVTPGGKDKDKRGNGGLGRGNEMNGVLGHNSAHRFAGPEK